MRYDYSQKTTNTPNLLIVYDYPQQDYSEIMMKGVVWGANLAKFSFFHISSTHDRNFKIMLVWEIVRYGVENGKRVVNWSIKC